MPKRKRVRVLQFKLPYPPFQPEPYDHDGGPGRPHQKPRAPREVVNADQQAVARQGVLWKEAA